MPEHHHRLDVVLLLDLVLRQHGRVEPARRRDAGRIHQLRIVEAGAQPRRCPSPRRAHQCCQAPSVEAVVERQGRDIETHIARALHVVVAAERIGAVADAADIAGGQQQDATGAHIGRADRVLGLAHRPDQAGGLLLGKGLGNAPHLRLWNAGHPLDLVGRPFLDFLADLIHAVDALLDELLVLPAVLEDVPEHPIKHRDVGAGPYPHKVGRVCSRARHPRIDDDHVRAVELLAFQHMLQRHRMRLGRIGAQDQHGLGVADIVEAVGHRAVAPGIGQAGDGGGMADACCVIDVVGAPERRELAEDVGILVGEFGGAEPVDGIRPGLFANRGEFVANFVDGRVPAHADPVAVEKLHRIFQPAVAMHDFACRSALGAMRAAVDRRVPGGLLTDPHAVGDLRLYRAADRTERADALADGNFCAQRAGGPASRLAHAGERKRAEGREAAGDKAGTAQESRRSTPPAGLQRVGERAAAHLSFRSLDQHGMPPLLRAGSD